MPTLRRAVIAVLLGVWCVPGAGLAAPGDLDQSFGAGGVATTPVGGGGAFAVALQSDGKIVAAGSGFFSTRFAVVRYLPTGLLDPTFGSGGFILALPPGAASGVARSVAVQPDGRIVVAGEVTDATAAAALGVVRLLPDGQPDATFGGAGGVVTGTGVAGGRALALQPDGRIVVAGKLANPIPRFALVRYMSDGSIDPSFGDAGVASTAFDVTKPSEFSAVLRQPDGSFIAAGPAVLRDDGIPNTK